MAFNVNSCVNSLMKRAKAKSTGYCAMYVRMAMESGGLNTSTRPNWAWKYINWLPSQGWSCVGRVNTRTAQAEFTTTQAQPGDIAVYQKPGCGSSQPGHICMWSGKNWISDFRQNNMNVYRGECSAYIYRYTGEISNSGDILPDDTSFTSSASYSGGSYSSGSSDNRVSGLINGQANTVMQLASNGERSDVLKISDNRKSQFESLRNSLKSNMIDMGRTLIESPEMYNSSILKTSQTAKQERT